MADSFGVASSFFNFLFYAQLPAPHLEWRSERDNAAFQPVVFLEKGGHFDGEGALLPHGRIIQTFQELGV